MCSSVYAKATVVGGKLMGSGGEDGGGGSAGEGKKGRKGCWGRRMGGSGDGGSEEDREEG